MNIGELNPEIGKNVMLSTDIDGMKESDIKNIARNF
jgi:hypothetical protein